MRCRCSWRSGAGWRNRRTSTTSARIFAALIGPTPLISQQRGRVLGRPPRRSLLQLLQSRVEPLQLGDVVQGELLAGLPDRVAGSHRRQQRPGPGRAQMPFRAARNELAEHLVQPVHGRDPQRDDLLAAVGQHPQDLGDVIRADRLKVTGAQPGHGHRERVGVVGLAAAATTQRADPGGQLGRHVEHRLALGDQPLRQPGTHPAGTLHRPDPVPVRAGERLHRPVAGPVIDEPLLGQHPLVGVDHHQRVARLVRIDPDHNSRPSTHPPQLEWTARRAELLPAKHTPLEPLPASDTRQGGTPLMSHTETAGSQLASHPPSV